LLCTRTDKIELRGEEGGDVRVFRPAVQSSQCG